MTPEDIANAIVRHASAVPQVRALADMTGAMVYSLALEFVEHLPETEGALLVARWEQDGPKRAAYLFAQWCASQALGIELPTVEEPPFFTGRAGS